MPPLARRARLQVLRAGSHGASALAWSPTGSVLAVALAHGSDSATLRLYSLDVGGEMTHEAVYAHRRLVHQLDWSADGAYLLSVSADGTAKVWHADATGPQLALNTALAHPGFVYSGRFRPHGAATKRERAGGDEADGPPLLATGGADGRLRLWNTQRAEQLAEAPAHSENLNSLSWADDTKVWSAGSDGSVRLWMVSTSGGAAITPGTALERRELSGKTINSLELHPFKRRILLQLRDEHSSLLALDTRLGGVGARYAGHAVGYNFVRASYSPDGRFVVAGGLDGTACVWAEDSCQLISKMAVGVTGPVLHAAWSAVDGVVAFCSHGPTNPIVLTYHNPNIAAANAERADNRLAASG